MVYILKAFVTNVASVKTVIRHRLVTTHITPQLSDYLLLRDSRAAIFFVIQLKNVFCADIMQTLNTS